MDETVVLRCHDKANSLHQLKIKQNTLSAYDHNSLQNELPYCQSLLFFGFLALKTITTPGSFR